MTEWSADHVAAIGFINLNFEVFTKILVKLGTGRGP
jgi:hypothetical protein